MAYGTYVYERDVPNGAAGRGFMVIGGRNIEMFFLKNIKISGSFDTQDFKVVGANVTQKKTTGLAITGTATIYECTPEFVNMAYEYLQTGKLPEFNVQLTNDDPATSIGAQTIQYSHCKLTELDIQTLDADQAFTEANIGFNALRFAPLESFHAPSSLGS